MATAIQSKLNNNQTLVEADAARQSSSLFRAVMVLTLLNGVGFVWAYRFIPLADYPDWIYQGWLFSKLIRGTLVQHYVLKRYPVPYWMVTLVLGLLDLLFKPEISGKIAVTAVILFFALSSSYLLKSLTRSEDNPLLYVPLLFVFSTWLFDGELSYVIGLSFLFMFCGYLFRRLGNPASVSGWLVLLNATAMFFCHPMPYLIAGLIGALVFVSRPNMHLLGKLVLGFLPSSAMLIWYAVERFGKSNAEWVFWTPHLIAGTFLKAFSPFHEFLPWLGISLPWMGAVALLDLLVAASIVGLWPICAMLWWRGTRGAAPILTAAGACLVGFATTGFAFSGWVGPGERFLYPAAWLAMCWLGGQWHSRKSRRLAIVTKWTACALLLMQAIYLDVYVGIAARGLQDLHEELREARSHAQFCSIYEDYLSRSWDAGHRRGLNRLLSNHGTVLRLPYYLYTESGASAPIFQLGFFNYDGPGSNEDLCK